MNNWLTRKGVTLIEVIMVVACFAIASLPVIGIYSMSIDNVKNIETRSLVYSCNCELIDQLQTLDIEGQEGGKFLNFPSESGKSDFLSDDNHSRSICYSSAPDNFVRVIEISENEKAETVYDIITVVEANSPFSFHWRKERSNKRGGR